MRTTRYESASRAIRIRPQTAVDDLSPHLGRGMGEWLGAQILDFVDRPSFEDDFDYADNFRVADSADAAMVRDLEDMHKCCGEAMWTFRHPSGRTYILAWDYGH